MEKSLRIIINRCKFKRSNNNDNDKIVAFIEGHSNDKFNHNQSICISNTTIITPGASILISISNILLLNSLVLYVSILNKKNNTSTKIGFGELDFDLNSNADKDIEINILDINNGQRIAKIYCSLIISNIDNEISKPSKKDSNIGSVIDFDNESSEFVFQELSKPINWGKFNSINLDRVVQSNNIETIMSCIDDIRYGDISKEHVDPTLYQSINISQYTVQYLMYCQKLLSSRGNVIKAAIDTFDKEEEVLDIKIAKLRAREKALRRESKSLDDLHKNYLDIYESLEPKLHNKKSDKKVEKNKSKIKSNHHNIDRVVDENENENTEPISSNISSTIAKEAVNKINENFEKKYENIEEIELVDIDDDVNIQVKESIISKVSVDSLNIEDTNLSKVIDTNKTNKETANSWTIKPSWVDAAGKGTSSIAFSSVAISVDSLNINRNTETFEEDSLFAPKVDEEKTVLPLKVSEEIEFNSPSKITGSMISVPAPKPDLTFMNESWDDSSDLEDKNDNNNQESKAKVLELEDFEESGGVDHGNHRTNNFDKKISFESNIVTDDNIKNNNRMRYSEYDEDDSISKTAKDFAKNAEEKLLKSLVQDDLPSHKDIPPRHDAKIEYDTLYGASEDINNYDHDNHEVSYDHYGSSIDASMSVEIDPFAESSTSHVPTDEYQALSKDANDVIASYKGSKVYDKEDFKSEGLRTGVLNYLHRDIDRDISPSTVNFNATNSGRLIDDDGDDVLLGTARLKGSFADTGSTQRSQYSDSADDIEQKLDKLMSKAQNIGEKENNSNKSDICWINGRAPLDMIEIAHAIDLLISAVSLDTELQVKYPQCYVEVDFMGIISSPSTILPTNTRQSLSAINYAVHILINNREAAIQLSKYIENEGMNISISINIIDENSKKAIGQAVVDLYVMIEDEKPLIRQEIDIMSTEMGDIIGSVVIDVRGYQVLLRCS